MKRRAFLKNTAAAVAISLAPVLLNTTRLGLERSKKNYDWAAPYALAAIARMCPKTFRAFYVQQWQADMLETRRISTGHIAKAFNVPVHMLGKR